MKGVTKIIDRSLLRSIDLNLFGSKANAISEKEVKSTVKLNDKAYTSLSSTTDALFNLGKYKITLIITENLIVDSDVENLFDQAAGDKFLIWQSK